MDQEIKQSPVYGIAILVAAAAYITLMANLPLSQGTEAGARFWIGLFAAIGGAVIFGCALGVIKFAFKAIVEIAAVLLLLANACVGGIVWAFFDPIGKALLEAGIAKSENIVVVAVGGAAVLMFIGDMLAFIVLYPMARIAGTSLDIE